MKESKYLKYPTQAHGAIPAFNSYEAEAAWWDETDTGDPEIEAEMTPVTVRSTRNYSKPLQVRLDEQADADLQALAEEAHLKKSTLARQLLMERIAQEKARRKAS